MGPGLEGGWEGVAWWWVGECVGSDKKKKRKSAPLFPSREKIKLNQRGRPRRRAPVHPPPAPPPFHAPVGRAPELGQDGLQGLVLLKAVGVGRGRDDFVERGGGGRDEKSRQARGLGRHEVAAPHPGPATARLCDRGSLLAQWGWWKGGCLHHKGAPPCGAALPASLSPAFFFEAPPGGCPAGRAPHGGVRLLVSRPAAHKWTWPSPRCFIGRAAGGMWPPPAGARVESTQTPAGPRPPRPRVFFSRSPRRPRNPLPPPSKTHVQSSNRAALCMSVIRTYVIQGRSGLRAGAVGCVRAGRACTGGGRGGEAEKRQCDRDAPPRPTRPYPFFTRPPRPRPRSRSPLPPMPPPARSRHPPPPGRTRHG